MKMLKKYRVLYFGTWGYGKAGLEGLLASERVEIVKVFSKWDLQQGNPYLNQVFELADSLDLAVLNSSKEGMPKEIFWQEIFSSGEVDFIFSCCFDRFFPSKITAFPKIGAVNLHPSLLPAYRGVKPLENAMANGEEEVGVSLHELVKELDAGDILLQRSFPVKGEDTFRELYDAQCRLIREIVVEFFSRPEAWYQSKKVQDHSKRSEAPRLPFAIRDEDTVAEVFRKSQVSSSTE